MTELARPDLRFHPSWAAAVREFGEDGTVMHGSGLWEFDTRDLGRAALATEVERLLAQADPATERPADIVPCISTSRAAGCQRRSAGTPLAPESVRRASSRACASSSARRVSSTRSRWAS